MGVPINTNSNLLALSCTVSRDGDLLAENCVFSLPLCYSAPVIVALEFHGEVKRLEIRVMGPLCGEGCVILTSTVFD